MKIVKISDLHKYIGKAVAKQVCLKDGRLYLNTGSIITESIVKILNRNIDKLAYRFVSIHTDDSDDVEKNTNVISDELKFKAKEQIENTLRKISPANTRELRNSVSEIVENLYCNPDVVYGANTLFLAGGQDHAIHCLNVAVLSAIMAVDAGFVKGDVEKIALGAALHDIGKVKVDKRLLDMNYIYKSKEDFLEMQKHSLEGYQLIKDKIDIMSRKIVLLHHVWEDYEASFSEALGIYRSYPKKLNNITIDSEYKDLSVSIVQVADVFEAMTNKNRIYQSKKSKVKALEYIKSMKYIQFGSGVDYLINTIAPFDVGTEVILSNGDKAIIKEHTSMPERPVVKVIAGDNKERVIDLTDKENLTLEIVDEI